MATVDLLDPRHAVDDLDGVLSLELAALRERSLLRELHEVDGAQGPTIRVGGRELLLLASNNYLGLANHPDMIEAVQVAVKRYGVGSGASRLISGSMSLHHHVEGQLARFKGTEATILFATGYMANVGTIAALVGTGDMVISDRLNHASIFDGCRLSGATLRVFPHRDLDTLEALLKKFNTSQSVTTDSSTPRRCLVITDGVFSMDGHVAPLAEIVQLTERYGATLMVDDAHGTGALGSQGRGAVERCGVDGQVPVQMGTCSKALGASGGYVAGSQVLIDFLRNRARSFIYTTAPSIADVAAVGAAITIIERDGVALRQCLWARAEQLRQGLTQAGFKTMGSETYIIPVWLGSDQLAVRCSALLREQGVFAPPIRQPSVPREQSRLRLSVMATHSEQQIDEALAAIIHVGRELGVI